MNPRLGGDPGISPRNGAGAGFLAPGRPRNSITLADCRVVIQVSVLRIGDKCGAGKQRSPVGHFGRPGVLLRCFVRATESVSVECLIFRLGVPSPARRRKPV